MENNKMYEKKESKQDYYENRYYFEYLLSLKKGEENEALDYSSSFMYL
ncbi:MAG: hypothetical protein ACERKV_01490 [Clostridiaceae bacterium]